MWDELKGQLIDRNWVSKINESELTIRLINDSIISIRSADNYDALRGGKYNFAVLDEAASIDSAAWFQVIRPTLSDMEGDALFIGTPAGRNWFYDLYLRGQSQEDWASFQFTTLQGGRVSPEEVLAAQRDLDPRSFRQEYEATFENYQGSIHYAYGEHNIRSFDQQLDAYEPIYIGMDFNIDPMSAVIATYRNGRLHIFDEIEIFGSNTQELVQEIRTRYGIRRRVNVYPDASGAKRTTNSPGISDHIILQNAGFKLHNGSINPPVAEGYSSVNAALSNHTNDPKLLIDPKCRRVIESLNKHSYLEGTRTPDKKSGFDHMTDSIRYLVHGIMPLRVNLPINIKAPATRSIGRML